ncbi:MAG TPA: methyltransferase domain-containing protein [Solirubrobacteraceae bacterium]|nr:methyltransferase domain-containing protein [Solirubrobacteraceae bacterium]
MDDPREQLLDSWERAAQGWGRQAERWSGAVAPVSAAMLELAALTPGRRVIELAAGPGDLSLAAAALVAPTQVLCTDGVEAMVQVARERAEEAGVANIAFARTQLEWIDLPAASADVILCRFGLMLTVDPGAALQECRRVLVPGGRLVLAVQGPASANPWLTLPVRAAREAGLEVGAPEPDGGPGPFALADLDALAALLTEAGFFDVAVQSVDWSVSFRDGRDWLGQKVDQSPSFATLWRALDDGTRTALREHLERAGASLRDAEGTLVVPGRAIVAAAEA